MDVCGGLRTHAQSSLEFPGLGETWYDGLFFIVDVYVLWLAKLVVLEMLVFYMVCRRHQAIPMASDSLTIDVDGTEEGGEGTDAHIATSPASSCALSNDACCEGLRAHNNTCWHQHEVRRGQCLIRTVSCLPEYCPLCFATCQRQCGKCCAHGLEAWYFLEVEL